MMRMLGRLARSVTRPALPTSAQAMRRRDLFRAVLPRAAEPPPAPPEPVAERQVARIQPFDCLAATGCATCRERCPEPGAIIRVGRHLRVVTDACTGCGICQAVCPAPRNPIILLPARVAATLPA